VITATNKEWERERKAHYLRKRGKYRRDGGNWHREKNEVRKRTVTQKKKKR
jgi:hypothetical protein